MPVGARLFVLVVFAILGASFVATTATLASEFTGRVWRDIASMDSHLFVFFPTLGIVALAAFYLPASVFVDLYWRHVWHGRVRFIFGFLVVAIASYLIADAILRSPDRSLWEISPRVLAADRGEPAGCADGEASCQRMPLLVALSNIRHVSHDRFGLGAFIRDCSVASKDPLLERAGQVEARRFCFASAPLSNSPLLQLDTDCCKAQARLMASVRAFYAESDERSSTARVHAALLPLKVFFLLVVLVISVLLALHHKNLEKYYQASMVEIETGLLVGSICMLFFPLMSQAFIQSAAALYGASTRGVFTAIMPIISFLFMVWALLIGLFFYRRKANDQLVSVGRLGGLIASNFGIIKYNLLISVFAWALGAGASESGLLALVIGSMFAIILTAGATQAFRHRRKI